MARLTPEAAQAVAEAYALAAKGKTKETSAAPGSDDPRPGLNDVREIPGSAAHFRRLFAERRANEPATPEPQSEVITDNLPAPLLWHDEPGELDRLRRYFATQWRSDDFA